MGRVKKDSGLKFIANADDLKKSIEINTINQFIIHFTYVENYGLKYVKKLPDDCRNITEFFKSIRKLDASAFKIKRFAELWDRYNMTDITDYRLDYNGKADVIIDEDSD